MGITSSSDAVIKQVRSRIVGDVWGYMLEDSVGEIMKKELLEKFTDIVTEPYGRIDEFARGGACKELFRAMGDCVDENGYGSNKCGEQAEKMYNCMCSHPDYYQPMLASFKTVGEHIVKEHDVYLTRKQALSDDALAARKQAFIDEFRRFG